MKRTMIVILVLIVAVFGTTAAFAQRGDGDRPPRFDPEAACENFEARLENIAETLDLTAEELQAMLDEGMTFREVFEAQGVDPRDVIIGRAGERQDRFPRLGMAVEEIAEALGITVEELQAAREAGTTIPELAAENGVDLSEAFPRVTEMQAELAERLDLTVEELDAMLADGMTLREIAEAQGVELREAFPRVGPRGERLGFREGVRAGRFIERGLFCEDIDA